MNRGRKTRQELLLEIVELRTNPDVAPQRLQEVDKRFQAEMNGPKVTEQVLEERLKFETLLAELSAQFVNLPSDRIDSEIEETNV